MWKKAISFFLLGLALAGCGNNNNEAIGDSRLTPKVKEEMMEESNPGVPGVEDLDESRETNRNYRYNDAIPDMDGNSTKNGLDDNR